MKLEIQIPSVALTFDKSLTRKILRQAGNEIKRSAQSLIGRDASGRVYNGHKASGAGQPPANLTGALAASLKVTAKGDSVAIKDTVGYSKYLETGAIGGGGKKGSKNRNRSHKKGAGPGTPQTQRVMAPRPFISIAAEGEMPSLGKRIQAALSKSRDLKTLGK